MAKARGAQAAAREARREKVLAAWARKKGLSLAKLDGGQQWVVYAALQVADFLGGVGPLRRVLGYFLSHCGMEIDQCFVAAIVGTSERMVRKAKEVEPAKMVHSLRHPVVGHRKPKLKPEHAGPVAKFLVEHRDAEVQELLAFTHSELGVDMERHALRRFLNRYGLGCLHGNHVEGTAPFLHTRSTVAASC